jgi:aminoglycoside phosphotransferase (APT) family kinase protein
MHGDQLDVDVSDVARMVAAQFPEWADVGIERVAGTGTVTHLFRLGTRLVARFPLRDADPRVVLGQLQAEHAAMTEFNAVSTVPTPSPMAIGEPGHGYPLPWSVQTWIDGDPASHTSVASSTAFANDLARLIAAVQADQTNGRRFSGSGRGGDLATHDDWVAVCLTQSEGMLPVARLREGWARLRRLPLAHEEVMAHKDLIPGNVLVRDGSLVGVIDTGGYGPADPALDLVAGWHLLDTERRGILREALNVDDLSWQRGAAWAFQQAMGLVWYYQDSNPAMSELGRSTLQRLLDAPEIDV